MMVMIILRISTKISASERWFTQFTLDTRFAAKSLDTQVQKESKPLDKQTDRRLGGREGEGPY